MTQLSFPPEYFKTGVAQLKTQSETITLMQLLFV